MRSSSGNKFAIDWITVGLYLTMVILGWINIYAAVYDVELQQSIFNFQLNSGKQLYFILAAIVLIIGILIVDQNFYIGGAWAIYGIFLALLVIVLFVASNVKGATSWIPIGPLRFQPSEFAKFATALVIAKYLSNPQRKANQFKHYLITLALIAVPAVLIIAQKDTGSALVFGGFVFVLYREGLPGYFLSLGFLAIALFLLSLFFDDKYVIAGVLAVSAIVIAILAIAKKGKQPILVAVAVMIGALLFIGSVRFFTQEVLQSHQRKRIAILINPDSDPLGVGYQVTQSKIAIGSGGLTGKGFLEGTQTKFDFVPDQSTDFIFCTVGEEHGWLGSSVVVILYVLFIWRLIHLAERQKAKFQRIFGWCVASVFFMHFMINIGMTIGLFPVIGIPLPFFSYGGSSLFSFTILLFIFVKMDAHRKQVFSR
jgi:rod shape determining protein RodA